MSGLLTILSVTGTETSPACQARLKEPSALRVRVAELMSFSSPKRPLKFATSRSCPSKVVATTRAPGVPAGFGHTKVAH